MPRMNDMFPSRYLKAADCDEADLVVTIRAIEQESVGQGKDAADKWILYFQETDKGLVLNKTNTNAIAKLYGDDTDDWEGKKIALFATEVQFQSEMVMSIRVRTKAPKAAKQAAPAAKAARAEPAAVLSVADSDVEAEEGDEDSCPF